MRRSLVAPAAVLLTLIGVAACSGSSKPHSVKSANLLIGAGIAAENQGDYKGAAALFQRVLKMEPTNYYAHYDLGTIYQHDGQIAQALSEYGAALAANPSFSNALYNEGTIYQATNPSLAIPTFQHVVSLDPTNAAAFINLGTVELQLGMKAQARVDLLRGLALQPSMRQSLTAADRALVGNAQSRPAPSPSPTH